MNKSLGQSLVDGVGALIGFFVIIIILILVLEPSKPQLTSAQKIALKKHRVAALTNYELFYKIESDAIYKKYGDQYKADSASYHKIQAQYSNTKTYFIEITQTVLDTTLNTKFLITGATKVVFKDKAHIDVSDIILGPLHSL